MKGKIFNAQEESDLKVNFKRQVYENIIEFWDNYWDVKPLLCAAFEGAVSKFPDISLFAPSYSWQGMHDVELRVSLKTDGISWKRPALDSYLTELLDERIKIFYKKPEELQEIQDIADFLYERFLECEKKKLADSRLEKSGNDTITLYSWAAVDSAIYLTKGREYYYFGEKSRGSDIGQMLICSSEIFNMIQEKEEGIKRNYEKEIFSSFIGYFFPELHGCHLDKNILNIKQRFNK